MSRPNSIRAITLAGFQVFEKPTRIPLERLTFLFGPNSAGKSAVQDALEILAVVSAGKSKSYFDIGDASEREKLGYVVELFLRDVHGARHFLNDVGSGIGYVLPVLCAVYENGSDGCFIQQPELHLHPALQAAMADVFVQSSADGKQIVVETHSEHLLLRALKRVRQTHAGTPIAQELHLEADDLCVLYFNPLPDGTTTVKRLRVTTDGDFMDRWPRGFFSERDAELFDE